MRFRRLPLQLLVHCGALLCPLPQAGCRSWRLLGLEAPATLLCAVALVGCRSGGDLDALKRENFQLHEQVTSLEVRIDQCCRELRSTRDLLASKEQPSRTDGSRRGAAADDSSPSDLPQPPKVDLGTPGNDKKTPGPAPKYEPTPKYEPGKSGQGGPGPDASIGPDLGRMHNAATRRGDPPVAAITLNRELTSGLDADEARPGDEGLIVAIEPRSAMGEAVRVSGEVAIEAFDAGLWRQYASQPAKRRLAHVATWLFTAADAATWFDEESPRLRFELPWPAAGRPKSKDLHVVVRYKTADGRILEAQAQVSVQHTGQRPKFSAPLPPQTAPPAGVAHTPPTPQGDFSALKKPPEPLPAEVSRAPAPSNFPAEQPRSTVPSRSRPAWSPYR